MVSKIMKTISCKCLSIKNRQGIRRRHRRNNSIKKAAAACNVMVVLSRLGTQRVFKILTRTQTPHPFRPQLPPSVSPEKRTVFLDLDETLVHSVASPFPKRFDFVVRPIIGGKLMTFYVAKRPGVEDFLEKMAEKYEVVVFTAALKEYATLVLDRLDPNRVISHRLYRDSCRLVDGRLVKDLSGLGRDLPRVMIVDDNPNSYYLQPDNAVPVRQFVDDMADRELGRLLGFFMGHVPSSYEDVRDAVTQYVSYGGGSISHDNKDDDVDEDNESEMRDGKYSNKQLPVLTSISSSRRCMIISTRNLKDHFPLVKPVNNLECWTKTVLTFGSLFFIVVNVYAFQLFN